ncbi:MAG: winged helix-turn-helix domain-containing protein [Actinomycetota bacterium]
MAIEPNDPRPPVVQIADDFRRAIALGEIGPGDQLPSNSELKARYGVSGQTAQSAMNTLKTEGLAYGVPGRGVFVRTDLDRESLLADLAAADPQSPAYTQILTALRDLSEAVTTLRSRIDVLESLHQGEIAAADSQQES